MRMSYLSFALALALAVALSGCQTMRAVTRKITGRSTPATTRAAAAAEKTADPKKAGDPEDEDEKEPRRTLYDRLGGEKAIAALVDDLVARSAANPAVNFTREGTPRQWQATPQNVARLKTRLVQFLGTATGGPQRYEGEDMVTVHRGMHITDAEFDGFAADLKASMEKLGITEKEQKELLETVGSARGAIVEQPATPR